VAQQAWMGRDPYRVVVVDRAVVVGHSDAVPGAVRGDRPLRGVLAGEDDCPDPGLGHDSGSDVGLRVSVRALFPNDRRTTCPKS